MALSVGTRSLYRSVFTLFLSVGRKQYHRFSQKSSAASARTTNPLVLLSQRDVEYLLRDLCVEHGCCLPPELQAELFTHPPRTPHRFTEVVLDAEGLGTDRHSEFYRRVFDSVLKVFLHSAK